MFAAKLCQLALPYPPYTEPCWFYSTVTVGPWLSHFWWKAVGEHSSLVILYRRVKILGPVPIKDSS
ncbi:hypothetical protein DPMN_119006 [Dreissena polymorpha]|uniref:Uncharacterized protein n=1 Tax=Dreissena polymorpha TaxID=45954 RepID=A0A9D4GLQ6_DREPO|nr:hypothetical protein DPMN_119006 [Dreissena polymorpha]